MSGNATKIMIAATKNSDSLGEKVCDFLISKEPQSELCNQVSDSESNSVGYCIAVNGHYQSSIESGDTTFIRSVRKDG